MTNQLLLVKETVVPKEKHCLPQVTGSFLTRPCWADYLRVLINWDALHHRRGKGFIFKEQKVSFVMLGALFRVEKH